VLFNFLTAHGECHQPGTKLSFTANSNQISGLLISQYW